MQTFTCVNSALRAGHAGHAGHATRAKSDFVKSTTRARIRMEFTFSGLARLAWFAYTARCALLHY